MKGLFENVNMDERNKIILKIIHINIICTIQSDYKKTISEGFDKLLKTKN